MKKRKLSLKKGFITLLVIVILAVLSLFAVYKINTGKVSDDDTKIAFKIEKNSTFYSISNDLKEKDLIKSEFFYKIYLKLNRPNELKAGVYNLSKNMSVEEIIKMLTSDPDYSYGSIMVTFKEGITVKTIASIVEEYTNNTTEDVYNLLKDKKYLDELINEYWFLTDDIKNGKIYYSLEGYLFPDTYQLKEDMNVKQIFKVMLDNLELKLEPYKEDVKKSKYSIHEIITLASMIQSEGNNVADFEKMASVFLKRLDKKMKLQSCASAYYGDKKTMGVDKFGDSYKKSNDYNTYVIAALPIGPISVPGLDAIKAVLNPSDTEYLYFASDKNMKVYFSKTYQEHEKTVAQLKKAGNWYGS